MNTTNNNTATETTTYALVPTDDTSDLYAAGIDGNRFDSRVEAEAAIPGLRECGPDFDHEWAVVVRR